MKVVLTIAGSDSSGGAGIQADIKTIAAHGLYAESVITALTAQNTTGVYGILEAPPEFVAQELSCVFEDIPPDAVKIGMVSSVAIMEAIAQGLKKYKAKNIVVDPVMVATSGGRLMADGATGGLAKHLFPLATVITPNLPEAEVLSGMEVKNRSGMLEAAKKVYHEIGAAVLVKGGHLGTCADDLLYDGAPVWFTTDRVDTKNTHGTGCTLSSAIAANLAMGADLATAVQNAKDYITGALNAGLNLGKGCGPLDHSWRCR
ncbi:MAG TPA: bifunctional hydroxymethylpyrimidine kinase/phosphomethylpyrimidine kinase [Candidatus Acidoferrum sp.]|nr:bifunctional hydroxymethylpyrimidine kinase/phosphomethylpyrimidine kinase [Candidatus Acidoferrum sp.]